MINVAVFSWIAQRTLSDYNKIVSRLHSKQSNHGKLASLDRGLTGVFGRVVQLTGITADGIQVFLINTLCYRFPG